MPFFMLVRYPGLDARHRDDELGGKYKGIAARLAGWHRQNADVARAR
jgi:hypothetical protein